MIRDGERRVAGDVWHRALGAAAALALGVRWAIAISPGEVEACGVDELALLSWLKAATGTS